MKEIKIKDEFIKLGQALKLAGAVDSGLDAMRWSCAAVENFIRMIYFLMMEINIL